MSIEHDHHSQHDVHAPALDIRHAEPVAEARTETPAMSPLGSLKKRRAQIADKLFLELKVPRWDTPDADGERGPEIWVRYRPAAPSGAAKKAEQFNRMGGKKPDDWAVQLNAQVLVQCCEAVYAVQGDAPEEGEEDARPKISLREGDPYGTLTKFDPDLADALGIENANAQAVVRKLYFTEGDLIAAANKLMEWSGVANDEAEDGFLGS